MEKSFVADHFLYVPAIGFWIAVCASGQILMGRLTPSRRRSGEIAAIGLFAVIALIGGAMTVSRLDHWKDSEAFWTRAIETSPRAWVAWGNRGDFRARAGRWADARADLEEALELRPAYPEARFNLGYVLDRQGDLAGAREQYERAVALSPNFAEAHLSLGIVLARQGDRPGTRREIEAARSLDADIPVPPSIDAWLRETGSH
jgi:tetratricopeptide (TPR) repeat protein